MKLLAKLSMRRAALILLYGTCSKKEEEQGMLKWQEILKD
jgi:hypothetical protein